MSYENVNKLLKEFVSNVSKIPAVLQIRIYYYADPDLPTFLFKK